MRRMQKILRLYEQLKAKDRQLSEKDEQMRIKDRQELLRKTKQLDQQQQLTPSSYEGSRKSQARAGPSKRRSPIN